MHFQYWVVVSLQRIIVHAIQFAICAKRFTKKKWHDLFFVFADPMDPMHKLLLSPTKALAKLSNKVGFNVPTLLDPTLLARLAAHVGWCLSNNFCSIKCWIEFAFGQTFRPTILVDEKMLECFAALPTKLYPREGHVRPPSQSRIKA